MRTELVFIHGIGGPRDPEAACRQWTRELAEGARQAGHSAIADRLGDAAVRFCGYRDLFDAPGAQGGEADLDGGADEMLAELLREMVDAQLAEDPDEATREALTEAAAFLTPRGQAQGVGNLVGRMIDATTTLLSIGPLRRGGQWLSGRLMLLDLAQVARYLARQEHHDDGSTLDMRIRARLAQAIGDGPAVVVAHSLGTVVALETLHEYAVHVPLLVTLGSPIGMRSVVWPRLRPQPPATPDGVDQWLNYWDKDDIIVARRDLGVRPNSRGVAPVGRRVDSAGVWVHTATKYLAQPAVAGMIAEALMAGRAAEGPWAAGIS